MNNEDWDDLEKQMEEERKKVDAILETVLEEDLQALVNKSILTTNSILQIRMIQLLKENNEKLDKLYDKLCKKRCF